MLQLPTENFQKIDYLSRIKTKRQAAVPSINPAIAEQEQHPGDTGHSGLRIAQLSPAEERANPRKFLVHHPTVKQSERESPLLPAAEEDFPLRDEEEKWHLFPEQRAAENHSPALKPYSE